MTSYTNEYKQWYYKQHIEHITEYHKDYYQKNKETIRAKASEPNWCADCEKHITHRSFTMHLKSKKHLDKVAGVDRKGPILCITCNISITRNHYARHLKCQSHLQNANVQE